jgi:hypothetical protein
MLRRVLVSARYCAFLLVVLAGVTAVVHRRWLRLVTPAEFIADRRPLPYCDADMVARLGRLNPPRPGSFQVTTLEKPKGVVRVGCFGDSFTYGHETEGGLDFPAQLELALHAHGAGHVEVVNFGNTGFGLHQTHMMAELVAPRFDVDVALFAPLIPFWVLRDATFAQWRPPTESIALHGRYVLDGAGVRLVDPVGTTEAEQFHAYTRLLPPLRYLRYDHEAPAFLLAWLPLHRTLPNPFFYASDGEVSEGYRRLFQRQLDGPPAVFLDPLGGVAELLGEPSDPRRRLLRVEVPDRFPYMAPQHHWSPWGNRLVAEYALRSFDIPSPSELDVMETSVGSADTETASERPIAAHDEARVFLADRAVGGLYDFQTGRWETRRMRGIPAEAAVLVALAAPGQPLVDASFIPLAARPTADHVTAEVAGSGTRQPLAVRLRWVADGIARLNVCDGAVLASVAGTKVAGRCVVPVPWDETPPRRPLVIRLGDVELATVDAGVLGVAVRPAGTYYRIFADGSLPVDPASFPERGEIGLVLSAKGVTVEHVPLGRFHRTTRPLSVDFIPLRLD